MEQVSQSALSAIDKSKLPSGVKGVCKTFLSPKNFRSAAIPCPGKKVVSMSSSGQGDGRFGKFYLVAFKDAANGQSAVDDTLEAIGDIIESSFSDCDRAIWTDKMTIVTSTSLADQFNAKLLSKNHSSFRSIVDSFDGAVDRLFALHIANAFIAQCIPIGDAFNVDVKTWPPTSGLATGKVAFSVKPLVYAYMDRDVCDRFGLAFKEYVNGTLKSGRTDVLNQFKMIVEALCTF